MKKIVLASFLLALIFVGSVSISTSNPSGAPVAATGSPADGATCSQSGCHFGTPTAQTNILSTNVPAGGYVAGTTYSISVKVEGTGRKGFQVSPQKADGTPMGTLIAGASSKISPSANYITHSSANSAATAQWIFTWKAPAKGSGTVDFYGAFASSQSTTYTQKLSVVESSASAVIEQACSVNLQVYPNPLQSNINVSFDLKENSAVSANLLSIDGKDTYALYNASLSNGSHQLNLLKPLNIQSGIYFLQLNLNEKQVVKKVFVD